MRIKTKLTVGVGLLFVMITIMVACSTYMFYKVARATEHILVANYNSVEYTKNMLQALDNQHRDQAWESQFRSNCELQSQNITEPGERVLTDTLLATFAQYQGNPESESLHARLRQQLNSIMQLNMNAIIRKSTNAEKTASSAAFWVGLVGSLCFIIAYTIFFNIPSVIANPIKELSSSISEISKGNYQQRLHFQRGDEFGELAASFNRMATKLGEYERTSMSRLVYEKKRVETLINSIPDPILATDETGKILFANNEASNVMSLQHDALIGFNIHEVAKTNDLMKSLVAESSHESSPHTTIPSQPIKIYAHGKESYFEKSVVNVLLAEDPDANATPIGTVLILKNVTPFKELDAAKTHFIATISHEIKTPLASILMSLNLLDDQRVGALNAEQRDLIQSAKDDAERLLTIASELLKMSQVETGHIQLNLHNAEPQEIVRYAVDANKLQAEQKHVNIDVHCPPDIPEILVDSEKTAWVLTNLVSNAIRYSFENGTVTIDVKTNSDDIVEFSVRDTGRGIDEQYRDRVFDRYFTIPGGTSTGTGLGLAISKEFIVAQKGTIELHSEVGQGSNFIVRLPRV